MPKRLDLKKSSVVRLSKNAKIALRTAGVISEHLKSKEVLPEHVFIGVVLNAESLASRIIKNMGIDRDELIKKSFGGKIIEITKDVSKTKEITLSSESQEILRKAYDWSQNFPMYM